MSQRRKQPPKSKHHPSQILSGADVVPDVDPWARAAGKLPMTLLQRNFLIIVLALLVVSALLIWIGMTLLSTVPLFILALLLIAGRFVF